VAAFRFPDKHNGIMRDEKDALASAELLAVRLETLENAHILGPAEIGSLPIGRYRFHLLVKFAKPDSERVKSCLLDIVAGFPRRGDMRIVLDVDPAETHNGRQ